MYTEEMNELSQIVRNYILELKNILKQDFYKAVIYGSFARGEYQDESDIDIVIFTKRAQEECYELVEKIAEITFEYNVKYDIILSPVFQNINIYNRMLKVVPYFQSIQAEGVIVE